MWSAWGSRVHLGKQFVSGHALFKKWKIHTCVRTLHTQPPNSITTLLTAQYKNTPQPWLRTLLSKGPTRTNNGSGRRQYSSSYSSHSANRGKQVLFGLIGANVIVFIGWNTIGASTSEGARFMKDNFSVSLSNTLAGRLHTYVTACFSQVDPAHLLFNMLGLYMFGPAVLAMVGPGRFLGLYLVSGVVGNLFHMGGSLYSHNFNVQRALRNERSCLGASGSVTAISVINALAYPFQTWYLFMVVPVPGILAVGGFVGYDLFMANWGSRTGVAHLAHIGGAVAGAAYYAFIKRRLIRFRG